MSEIHDELAVKLGVPGSERFVNILNAMFTDLEATVCSGLFEPATCPELAARLSLSEAELQPVLDTLTDRGMLTQGPTQYAFHTTLLAFHHECVADTAPHAGPHAIPQHVKDLWNDFFRNEWSYMFQEHTEAMIKRTGRNLPISPSIIALEKSPNIKPEDILPEENFKQKIIDAKSRILAPCGCRVVWGECDHPLMTCFACFDRPRGEYYLDKPGRLLKEVTLEEALDAARAAEESGLVHWGDCYCCNDCCENLFPITRSKRYDLMTPNRFCAEIDEEQCIGCGKCVERCNFEAIGLVPVEEGSKKKKAVMKDEMCKGCGVCIVACPQDAMRYKIVRPKEYITGPRTDEVEKIDKTRMIPVWGHYNLQ
jgi:Na+-translocating ferredoxin:NAD+ oxidoreductase RNF subunit RnfB